MELQLVRQLTNSELDKYSLELEHALECHSEWVTRVNRTLILGGENHHEDVATTPHLVCPFGRWYHELGESALLDSPDFAAVGAVHAKAHALARDLLIAKSKSLAVTAADYDAFTQQSKELLRLLKSVRNDLRRNLTVMSRLMSKVFDNAHEGVVITTPEGTILTVNRAFTDVTGYSPAEAIGKTPHILYSGRQSKAFYDAMWLALTRDGQWQGEIWNRRKNGDVYLEWLSIASVRNEFHQLTHYVAIFSDITLEKENEERLYLLAHYDPLTSLPNRVLFQDRFRQALARARRGERKIGVMFLDLDGFKAVNDQFGHKAGDVLLSQVAERLLAQLRESDTVARLGGDEFAVILPDLWEEDGLASVAQKLIAAIAEPFHLEQGECRITTSIGISVYPKDALDADNLLLRADLAMYEAKRRGKNQYFFFSVPA